MNALTPATADLLLSSTALSVPMPAVPDAALVAASAEYSRLMDAFDATDMDAKPGTRRAKRAEAAQEKALAAIDTVINRMAGMVATTQAGVLAQALALGRHDPGFACAYDSADETHSAKLLRPFLRDAYALAVQPPQADPDAALIAASARFCAAEIEWRAANLLVSRCEVGDPNEPALEAEADRLSDIRDELLEPVLEAPCTTPAGAQSVARALVEWDQELLKEGKDYTDDRLIYRLVTSVLAMPGSVPPPPPPGADAGLLALCATFRRQQSEATDEDNEDWELAGAAKWVTFKAIDPVVPSTAAGHLAKAEVAIAMLDELNGGEDGSGCPAGQFALRMLRGWLEQAPA